MKDIIKLMCKKNLTSPINEYMCFEIVSVGEVYDFVKENILNGIYKLYIYDSFKHGYLNDIKLWDYFYTEQETKIRIRKRKIKEILED